MNDPSNVTGARSPIGIRLCAGLLLGLIGFAVNWFRLELFLGVYVLFGSIFVMLAILRYGPVAGVVAGAIAAACTPLILHTPWPGLILTAEALFVAWRIRNHASDVIVADILYWLLLGAPLAWLTHRHFMAVQHQATILIMLKLSLSGVFNALIATLIHLLWQAKRPAAAPPASFQQLLFVTMTTLVLVPAFMLFLFEQRRDTGLEKTRLAAETALTSAQTKRALVSWFVENQRTLETLARQIGNPEKTPPAVMQRQIDTIKAVSPAFQKIVVVDRHGISRAVTPRHDHAGRNTRAGDYSDQTVIPIIGHNREPYVTDVFRESAVDAPVVQVLQPLGGSGTYRGFCGGVVDTSTLREILASIIDRRDKDIHLTLIDRYGRVIVSTRNDLRIMDLFRRDSVGVATPFAEGVYHFIPAPKQGTSSLERWRNSVYVKEVQLDPAIGWTIICEASLSPLLARLSAEAILTFGSLAVLTILTLWLSSLFSNRFVQGIQQLETVTDEVSEWFIIGYDSVVWPESSIREIRGLTRNFRQMADTLRDYFNGLHALNESLEQRVAERTGELNETIRAFREAERIAQVGSWALDLADKRVYWSEELFHIFELEPLYTTPSHTAYLSVIHPEDREMTEARFRTCLKTGDHYSYTNRLLMPDGRIKHIQGETETVLDESGKPLRSFGTLQDITERVRALENLRESEQLFSTVFHMSPFGIGIARLADGMYTDVNDAFLTMFGYGREELLGNTSRELNLWPDQGERDRLVDKLQQEGSVQEFEAKYRHKSGKVGDAVISAVLIELHGEKFMMGMVADISARKQSEGIQAWAKVELERQVAERTVALSLTNEQLNQEIEERKRAETELLKNQKKLEQMAFELSLAEERERGRIAGELHDQVGQRLILGKIKINTLAHQLSESDQEEVCEEIEQLIDQSLQDIRSLTFQLRPPILATAGLEAAIQWLGEELKENFGLQIECIDDQQPKKLPYEIRTTLFQVVRELLLNVAKHAATNRAQVALKREADTLVVTIVDTGTGFSMTDVRNRKAKGGGFGLFNVRQRIEYLGGSIDVESQPGRGTSVTIEVPLDKSRQRTCHR